jgi:hypothetical protein
MPCKCLKSVVGGRNPRKKKIEGCVVPWCEVIEKNGSKGSNS